MSTSTTANPCAKMRKQDKPYETWVLGDWEWRVLKKWQRDDTKPHARWFCAVKSPYTFGDYELGDTYASEVLRSGAVKVQSDYS